MLNKSNLLISMVVLFSTALVHAAPMPGYQSFNGYTNDVGPDLATVMEYDVTKSACDSYQADLDQYMIDNDSTLSQLSDSELNLADLSERELYIIDNFVDNYDEEKLLQCGKYLFFYGHFDTTGAPQVMIDWLLRYFDDFFGPGMSNFGMYPDPNPIAVIPAPANNPSIGDRQLPVGIAHSSGDFGTADDPADAIGVYSFTCGACHLKKMDDGNYAIGIGNTEYDYARMIAAQGQLPLSTLLGVQGEAHDPDGLLATLAQVVTDSNQQYGQDAARTAFLNDVNTVITAGSQPEDLSSIQSTPEEQRRNWVTWTGGMDFLVRPMQDDGVHNLTRIMNTSAIQTDEHVLRQHGFQQKQGLSWNGGGYDLIQFIRGFITITPSDPVTPESRAEFNYWVKEYRYMPLVRYLETMDEPNLPTDRTFDVLAAKRGEAIFDQECTACHSGPGGETPRPYTHKEVGVEDTHANIMNPFWDPNAFGGAGGWENGIPVIAERFPAGITGEITRKVKGPRFLAMWDNNRLLHNASVGGLDELLTCAGNRTSYAEVIPSAENPFPTLEEHFTENPMFSNKGHEFGCGMSVAQKSDLKVFLETFAINRNVLNKYNGQFNSACAVRNNGTSYVVNLTFTEGRLMELIVISYSDNACSELDTTIVNNPSVALSWDMELDSTFTNVRGFESHKVVYSKPDGTSETGVIAIENGELANNTAGEPVLRNMHAKARTDHANLNGRWLNKECVGDTRSMAVIQDGYRSDKLVTYNGPLCTGGVLSVVNTGAWTFDTVEWLRPGITGGTWPRGNMRLRMKAVDGSGWTTQFINRWGDNFSTMFNNFFPARVNGNGEHYERISNIANAE